ncbi:DNA cytosine methyltransferase [Streptomyces sp. NPDC051561]|uniref:DNA cytosine methyltransferase n=1 Tax=Streptomyces sp. NPDC051561 TaxID=3365658 RepID=UPI0037B39430
MTTHAQHIPGTAVALPRRRLDDVLAATARPVSTVPGQSTLDDVAPEALRIGSLFTGYAGLDMGVQAVLGGEPAWHCQYDPEDKHQYAARILAHHWPHVPNLGDITAVEWQRVRDELGPVHIVTGGFPCTDLSLAGQRAGLMTGTRSGLWSYMLRAVAILRPRLVVIENVRGILSAKARSGMELEACCVEHAGTKPLLRALGAVLGDLAAIGFDAEWAGVRAEEVGAPHERFREFILAWPADADGSGSQGRGIQGAVAERLAAAADAACIGEREPADDPKPVAGSRHARAVARGRGGNAASDADGYSVRQQPVGGAERRSSAVVGFPRSEAAADAEGDGRIEGRTESAGELGRSDVAERSGAAAAEPGSRRREGHRELPAGRDAVQQRVRDDVDGCGEIAADTSGIGHRDPRPTGERGVPAPAVGSGAAAAADADGGRRDQDERDVREGQPDVAWGDYEPAIRRWETVLGRPHPWPNDDRGRLAPEFSEWMQGVPAGHVTSVPAPPGMSAAALRNARLKALGNGVVPLQAEVALRLLLDRVRDEPAVQALLADVERARRLGG